MIKPVRINSRAFPESLSAIEYARDVEVRRASTRGVIKFAARSIRISLAFAGEPIGMRPIPESDVYEVLYAHQSLGPFDLGRPSRDGHETLAMYRVPRVHNE